MILSTALFGALLVGLYFTNLSMRGAEARLADYIAAAHIEGVPGTHLARGIVRFMRQTFQILAFGVLVAGSVAYGKQVVKAWNPPPVCKQVHYKGIHL